MTPKVKRSWNAASALYKVRHAIERMFCHRHDRLAANFLGNADLAAAIMSW